MSQQFCLKWNNHTTNMLQVFESLLSTEALVDVTLACDGLSLKAHKMVLSACSPFFQSLFLENPCKHPIVIMKDMRYCDLKAIIDFMYRGEVNVSHDQLSALLKTAETLKVKGLAEVTGENRHASGIVQQEITQQQQSAVSTPTPTPLTPTAQRTDTPPLQGKRKRGRPRKRSLSDSNRSDDEGVASKIKERDSPDVEELSGDASMDATSDIRSGGGPGSSNSQSQVPSHSSNNVNSFSKSHLSISQDPQVDETSGDENEFEVEPSKLLEQTLTTDNVPSSSQNSTGHIQLPSVSGLEISRRSMSSTDSLSQALVPASDSLGSNLQAPDSPQDIKPQILSFDDPPISPVAGPSHSERSMMMYMDQSGVSSIPGPSNYQDNSALVPHDSQPQGPMEVWIKPESICASLGGELLEDIEEENGKLPQISEVLCSKDMTDYNKEKLKRHLIERDVPEEDVVLLFDKNVIGKDFFSITNSDLLRLGMKLGIRKRLLYIIENEKNIFIPSVEEVDRNASYDMLYQDDQILTFGQISSHVLALKYAKPETIPVLDAVKASDRGKTILKSLESNKVVSQSDVREIVRAVITLAVKDLQTMYPSYEQKINIAKAIVMAIPQLKNEREGCEGFEQFYDPKSRTGMIEWRLKTVRLTLRPSEKKYNKRRRKSTKVEDSIYECMKDACDEENMEEKISWLKLQEPSDVKKAEIFKSMAETFKIRRKFIAQEAPTITDTLDMYPKLKDFQGELIDVEFSMMHPNAESFLKKFASFYTPRILKFCRESRLDIFARHADIADENLSACLALADLLQVVGLRKKFLLESNQDPKKFPSECMIRFPGENVDFDALAGEATYNQEPFLTCEGDRTTKDLKFFLVLGRNVVNVGCCPIRAIDLLYKSHYVFNVLYSKGCENFYLFLDFVILQLKKGATKSSIENMNVLLNRINI